jgi:histidyl-tRNA synthetase
MIKLSSQPYKGTRDYYPADKRVQNYIFNTWRRVVESFGYEEYGAPLLEPLEVYTAKSGQELANEQTYSFTDRGSRVVAIRPEMTPSISRMVAHCRQELAYPARLYSIANFMRYERPQRGREREFWQLNADIFGVDGVLAEAEIIDLSDKLLKELGAKSTDYVIRVNNRKLINFVMAKYLDLDAGQAQLMIKLFDRKNKITHEDFLVQASEIFNEDGKRGLAKLTKLTQTASIADLPEEIRNSQAVKEAQELFTLLERNNVTSAIFDITLMRGLDYYTGMVFEVFDTDLKNSRAMFGGGRYDGLVGIFGAEPISAVGVAPGGTAFENFLEVHKLLPELNSTTDVYIADLDGATKYTYKLACDLREAGINAELDITSRKPDKQIKTAIKKQITYIIFVGENEVATATYPLKNLKTEIEKKLKLDQIIEVINNSKFSIK